jgi:hypothetical protein
MVSPPGHQGTCPGSAGEIQEHHRARDGWNSKGVTAEERAQSASGFNGNGIDFHDVAGVGFSLTINFSGRTKILNSTESP